MTEHDERSSRILSSDILLATSEILAAAIIFYLLGGIAWIGWGLDSLGELVTALVAKFYVREKHPEGVHDHSDHSEHIKERRASKYIAYLFYIFAGIGLVWSFAVGEEPTTDRIVWWPQFLVIGFLILTAWMGHLKLGQSEGRHDPMWGAGMQSVICVASSVIAAAAGFFQHWISWSQMIGNILIALLMIYAGHVTYKNERLCSHGD